MIRLIERKAFSVTDIKTDEKMNFYTGITTLSMCNAIFTILQSFIQKITLERAQKDEIIINYYTESSQKKLQPKDALML